MAIKFQIGNTDAPLDPSGGGVPAGGDTGAPLIKSSGADYDTEWGANNPGSEVSKVSGSNFTLNAGRWTQWGKIVILSFNFHITANIANGQTIGEISGPPLMKSTYVAPTVLCRAAGNSSSLAAISIANSGDYLALKASGTATTGQYYVAEIIYMCD